MARNWPIERSEVLSKFQVSNQYPGQHVSDLIKTTISCFAYLILPILITWKPTVMTEMTLLRIGSVWRVAPSLAHVLVGFKRQRICQPNKQIDLDRNEFRRHDDSYENFSP